MMGTDDDESFRFFWYRFLRKRHKQMQYGRCAFQRAGRPGDTSVFDSQCPAEIRTLTRKRVAFVHLNVSCIRLLKTWT